MDEREERSARAAQVRVPAPAGGFAIFSSSPCVWPLSMAGQPGAPVRVVIVDSDAQMRSLIGQELGGDSRTRVVGEADTLRESLRLVRDVAFDVLIVDVGLEDGAGCELISHARSEGRRVEVVALSKDSEDDALRSFQLGAAGFIVKNARFIGFVQAVLRVANGGAAITPALSRRLVAQRAKAAAPAQAVAMNLAALRAPEPATP